MEFVHPEYEPCHLLAVGWAKRLQDGPHCVAEHLQIVKSYQSLFQAFASHVFEC